MRCLRRRQRNEEYEMHVAGGGRIHSELRGLIVEASLALASLDGGRLEELAQCCRALNADPGNNLDARFELQRQAREAARELEVLGGVLDATRANLEVINRMRE